jgi:hypothetical protein
MFPSKKFREKPTQIRGNTQRTKARKQAQKDHEKHNFESSIQTRKDSQGLACRPSIHPFQQISHEALMLDYRKMEKKIATKIRNGRGKMKP